MRLPFLALAALIPTATVAATEEPIPRIIVSGLGTISTTPDRAVIEYGLHGEGTTSDEAVAALVAKRKTIEGGMTAIAGTSQPKAGQISVNEVRGSACNRYEMPKMSTGDCAILGYSADVDMQLTTGNVKDAATLVGLIGRLGGRNPRLDRYTLADDKTARAQALAAAIGEARTKAEAMAEGAHVTLGRIISISDGSYGAQPMADIVVTGSRVGAPPPPPPPPPPVEVNLTPRPIETQAHVQVVFAIGG